MRLRKTLTGKGVDAGGETIAAHLAVAWITPVPAVSTIWRIQARRGFVTPDLHLVPVGSVLEWAHLARPLHATWSPWSS